jgi:hypothetical protein
VQQASPGDAGRDPHAEAWTPARIPVEGNDGEANDREADNGEADDGEVVAPLAREAHRTPADPSEGVFVRDFSRFADRVSERFGFRMRAAWSRRRGGGPESYASQAVATSPEST